MDKPKYYSEKGEQSQKVSEPMAVYNSTVRSAGNDSRRNYANTNRFSYR